MFKIAQSSPPTSQQMNFHQQQINFQDSVDFHYNYHNIASVQEQQQNILNTIGNDCIQNIQAGKHCCLLAFGQCASGKTTNIVGVNNNHGQSQLIVERLFQIIPNLKISVSTFQTDGQAVLDILNNKLVKPQSNSFINTKLKQVDLNNHQVYCQIIQQSLKVRNSNCVQMNARASTIHFFIQVIIEINQQAVSLLFADLAPVCKLDYANKEKIKEYVKINQSITDLIQCLSNIGMNKKPHYRTNSLTHILQPYFESGNNYIIYCLSDNEKDKNLPILSKLKE
ncbi:hypothetical protein pb186bvf_006862 [Paramecium bursaria]